MVYVHLIRKLEYLHLSSTINGRCKSARKILVQLKNALVAASFAHFASNVAVHCSTTRYLLTVNQCIASQQVSVKGFLDSGGIALRAVVFDLVALTNITSQGSVVLSGHSIATPR